MRGFERVFNVPVGRKGAASGSYWHGRRLWAGRCCADATDEGAGAGGRCLWRMVIRHWAQYGDV